MIGKTIGNRYEVTAFLGRGGMAWVYRATDRKTGRPVALKILYPQFSDDSSYIQRFIREAKLALTLDHPNVVRVLDYGADRDVHYLAMEYIEGQDLKEVLRTRGGALPPEESLDIARQVASALQQAYHQGIVHRDIKPQNLMRTPDGLIKVLDFGIARAEDFATITGSSFVGSPYYVAPEQAMSQAVDIRSDIYSLGVVLYELLTGQLPFDAETPWSIISQHISHVPLPVSEIRSEVPRPIADLVSKMLAKHPNDRHQTPAELIEEIDALLSQLQAHEEQTGPEEASSPERPEGAKKKTAEPLQEETGAGEETATPAQGGVLNWPLRIVAAFFVLFLLVALRQIIGGQQRVDDNLPSTPQVVARASMSPSLPRVTATLLSVSPTAAGKQVSATITSLPSSPTHIPTRTPHPSPTVPPSATSVPATGSATPVATRTPTPLATPSSPTVTPPVMVTVATHNRIAFKSDREGQENIFIMDPDGSHRQLLRDIAVYQQAQQDRVRSPDNLRQVLVHFITEENAELFIRWLDNRGPETQVVHNPALDYDPAWSPDGIHIAFVSQRQGSDNIFVLEVPGRNDRQLTHTTDAINRHPSWSPDGSQIVYWSDQKGGKKQIWIMNADGTSGRRISDGLSNDWDPEWIP